MRLKLSTHLGMVRACVAVAQSSDYKPVWSGNSPSDFGAFVARLIGDYDAVTAKATLVERAAGGAADAKAAAEAAVVEAAFIVARALRLHFKRSGDLERRALVDLSRSDIGRVRSQHLLVRANAIREIGAAVVGQPGAEGLGITSELIDSLGSAIANFAAVLGAPRSQIVNRATLLREVEDDVAALIGTLEDLDDLVVQFARTPEGRRFVSAWRRARMIVDLGGGGAAQPEETSANPTTTARQTAAQQVAFQTAPPPTTGVR